MAIKARGPLPCTSRRHQRESVIWLRHNVRERVQTVRRGRQQRRAPGLGGGIEQRSDLVAHSALGGPQQVRYRHARQRLFLGVAARTHVAAL
jgi:hypothetical protein